MVEILRKYLAMKNWLTLKKWRSLSFVVSLHWYFASLLLRKCSLELQFNCQKYPQLKRVNRRTVLSHVKLFYNPMVKVVLFFNYHTFWRSIFLMFLLAAFTITRNIAKFRVSYLVSSRTIHLAMKMFDEILSRKLQVCWTEIFNSHHFVSEITSVVLFCFVWKFKPSRLRK